MEKVKFGQVLVWETQHGEAWSLGRLFSIKMSAECTACANVERQRSPQTAVHVLSTTHTYEGLGCLDIVVVFSSRFGIERRSERAGFTTELKEGLSNRFVHFNKYLSHVSCAHTIPGAGRCSQHKGELDPALALKE